MADTESLPSVRGLSDCRRSPHHQRTHPSHEIRQQWGWLGLINSLASSNLTLGSVTAVWTDGAREIPPPTPESGFPTVPLGLTLHSKHDVLEFLQLRRNLCGLYLS